LQKANKEHWETMFEGFKNTPENTTVAQDNSQQNSLEELKSEAVNFSFFQLNKKYIVSTYNKNVLIVDQQRAHERIVYEHYLKTKLETKIASQQLLFPEQMELSANDFTLIKDLTNEFKLLGFDYEVFGKNSIVINGTPSDLKDFKIIETVEGILETFKLNTIDSKIEKHDNLCRAIAYNTCIKYGKQLEEEEMRLILEHLINCENPLYTASGKSIMMEVDYLEIEKFFKK
jgi:DNA mismatch repair protein MutL